MILRRTCDPIWVCDSNMPRSKGANSLQQRLWRICNLLGEDCIGWTATILVSRLVLALILYNTTTNTDTNTNTDASASISANCTGGGYDTTTRSGSSHVIWGSITLHVYNIYGCKKHVSSYIVTSIVSWLGPSRCARTHAKTRTHRHWNRNTNEIQWKWLPYIAIHYL